MYIGFITNFICMHAYKFSRNSNLKHVTLNGRKKYWKLMQIEIILVINITAMLLKNIEENVKYLYCYSLFIAPPNYVFKYLEI